MGLGAVPDGVLLGAGARVLAGTGDDRSRFTDAKELKAYADSAPITRASGKTRSSVGLAVDRHVALGVMSVPARVQDRATVVDGVRRVDLAGGRDVLGDTAGTG
jgi:hypothetical protein